MQVQLITSLLLIHLEFICAKNATYRGQYWKKDIPAGVNVVAKVVQAKCAKVHSSIQYCHVLLGG